MTSVNYNYTSLLTIFDIYPLKIFFLFGIHSKTSSIVYFTFILFFYYIKLTVFVKMISFFIIDPVVLS